MKLSMMSYTMSRQKEHFSLRGMFELSRELKLDGIDFVRLYERPPQELKTMADDYEIPIVCHTFFTDFNQEDKSARQRALDQAAQSIEAAVILGAPTVMIPTGHARKGQTRKDARQNWIAGLQKLMPIAEDAGVTVTVENFPGRTSPFVTAADFMEAQQCVPGLRLTYDNGNAATGENPAASFEETAPYVVHAHFKDWYRSETPEKGFRQMLDGAFYRPALIGEGVIDHKTCLTAMADAGYDGYVNIEYEGDKYTPQEAMRRAVPYLREILDRS